MNGLFKECRWCDVGNIDECIVGGAVLFGAEELFVGRDDESVYYEKKASQSSACTQRTL